MAYPANLAVTNWGSLQSGNTSDLDTNFRNIVVALNGIGNGTTVLPTVAITTAGIGLANITTMTSANVVITGGTATLSQPLGIGSGGTNATTFGNNAVVIITAGSMTSVLPGANGTVLTSNGTAWGPAAVAASGGFPAAAPVTNSLGADVALANTTIYFDGPSVAQGTSGTWLATGTVTIISGASGGDVYAVKLWDGTTVIASLSSTINSANQAAAVSLSGVLPAPAGNIRISAKPTTHTDGFISHNNSGNSKDSTITAYRIL